MANRLPRILRRLIAPFTWNTKERDIDQEMAFHVESLKRDYLRSGRTESDAEREAHRRFGSTFRLKEQSRDVFSIRLIEDLLRELRHEGRILRRSPVFALAVVLTLALGIGANTAIFSVVDQLLLRPLPYPNGDQLVTIHEAQLGSLKSHFDVSPANWFDWQRQSRTLQQVATWRPFGMTLTGVGEPARLNAQLVSSEFFPLLGVTPLLGRTVSAQDDRPNAPVVVVLSYRLWQRRFGGDPNIISRVVQMNDRPAEIIGVMPASFRFIYLDNDVWGAARLNRNQPWRETAGRFLNAVGRVKADTTVAASRAELTGLAARLAATYDFNKNTTVDVVPLREALTGQVHTSLLVLYAAVALLLTIACFNVASLLLARAASRQREIAIRAALGAGRPAIVRQLLVESVLLALTGGVLGMFLARWSLDTLVAFAPADLLRASEITIDRRVLTYAIGLSLLTGVVVGLVPAVAVARRSIIAWTHAGGRVVTQSARIRQILVASQVALTVVLLCGSGLLVRTVMALNNANSGFDKRDLLTMEVQLPPARYNAERATSFYHAALSALREIPGVDAVAAANSLAVIGTPRGGTSFYRLGSGHSVNERPSATSGDGAAVIRVVSPGYFHALRIPVLRGREFGESDDANPTPGFIVNEAFARTFLSSTDPLKESLSVWMQDQNPYLPIIGVAGDVSEGSIRAGAKPTVFYSLRQMGILSLTFFMRTGQPTAIASNAVGAIHSLDKNLAVTKVRTVESAFAESLAREQLSATVSAAFALSGLLLAALGLYGLLAFLVAERTKEIGIRITLGARVNQLIRSVVGGGLGLVAIGAVIGVGGALVLFRLVGSLLFGVTPYDVSTYAAALTTLFTVAAVASYVPARRAARVEPVVALRQE
ncbi:MAG TPA: ABC transporter permease [Vicinamibacterales bacterium]|jgi:putative ABC transport system permease protein|nr:ABC transporter permease [Vicinamibacterales bacterium]